MNGALLSNEPILLFLHGVGNGDPQDLWMGALTQSLISLGYPSLDSSKTIAPKYSDALLQPDDKASLPGVTSRPLSREAAKKNRRDFERRMAAIEFRLGRHEAGNSYVVADTAAYLAVGLPLFQAAKNYLDVPHIRADVLTRILAQLPESGKLVIVGHSLGSVIAADLISRLPQGTEVVGMVTIGSPLASGRFDVDDLRKALKDPPINLAWWANFWNAPDPVAAYRGVSSAFPWMIDFRVDTKAMPLPAHGALEYLGDKAVAEAIGFGLFGSRSTELVSRVQSVDVPLDDVERLALLALRYAHLINVRLEGEVQDRYSGAVRQVQAKAIDEVIKRISNDNRLLPSEIARLSFDFSDPQVAVPEPLPGIHILKEEAILFLTVLATENIIVPFDIGLPKGTQQDALRDLTAEMGLTSSLGGSVMAAVKLSHEVVSGKSGTNWIKWTALGAGAAALVLATGGLALAAAPGLAGAAVITSALATFGPGGMIGGLLTAGSLATAGGGGIAFGLASSGTSAETLEAVVERQLATAILRQEHGFEPNPGVWSTLVETEMRVRREKERLDEFSDSSAPILKELIRKIEAVERALKYMKSNGLEPGAIADVADRDGENQRGGIASLPGIKALANIRLR